MTTGDLEAALGALNEGRLVVMPTDTVYGLAARPDRPSAVEAIFSLKGRPRAKPLPVLAAGVEELAAIVVLDERVRRLAARFWPGPLTVVVPRAPGFDTDLGGSGDTLGVRVPASDLALGLLRVGGPLAVTSANRSGEAPPATAQEARRALGDSVSVYLDAGRVGGEASTVVSLAGEPELLRAGPISLSSVLATLDERESVGDR